MPIDPQLVKIHSSHLSTTSLDQCVVVVAAHGDGRSRRRSVGGAPCSSKVRRIMRMDRVSLDIW